jgi:hypothetical protein
MRKYVVGIMLGVTGTLVAQHLFRTNEKLQAVIDKAAKEFGLDNPNQPGGRTLNLFDKCSLIWQRLRRK